MGLWVTRKAWPWARQLSAAQIIPDEANSSCMLRVFPAARTKSSFLKGDLDSICNCYSNCKGDWVCSINRAMASVSKVLSCLWSFLPIIFQFFYHLDAIAFFFRCAFLKNWSDPIPLRINSKPLTLVHKDFLELFLP